MTPLESLPERIEKECPIDPCPVRIGSPVLCPHPFHALAAEVREMEQNVESLYSEAPCRKCGYGITGACYGCMLKKRDERIAELEGELAETPCPICRGTKVCDRHR